MEKLKGKHGFVEMIEYYESIIYNVCWRFAMGNPDLAKDLFQEIVLRLWKGYEKHHFENKDANWVYRVSMNTAISCYREKKRCPLLLELDSATELSISQQEEDDSMLKELYELIEQLSPIEKSIIYLYLDKNSYKEIGEIIGISPAYVGTRIQRIKQKLRRLHEGRIGHKKRV